MSLGPPFDASGERLQLSVGAGTVVVLTMAVFLALLFTSRTLGETFTLRVRFRTAGPLRTGAKVQLGGQLVGEVVAIRSRYVPSRYATPSEGDARVAAEGAVVEVEARLLREYQRHVYQTSTVFAWSPSVLTEALLVIGPPRGDPATPEPVRDGQTLRGQDPAEVGLLLQKVHSGVEAILAVGQELRPAWTEFRAALQHLDETAGGAFPPGLVSRVYEQGRAALDRAQDLRGDLQGVNPRAQALLDEARLLTERLRPELVRISADLDQVEGRVRGLIGAVGPGRRQQLLETVAMLRTLTTLWGRLLTDLNGMVRYIEQGRGTVGGFQSDVQIFEEMKETFRLIKRESWRLLIKTKDPGQRDIR